MYQAIAEKEPTARQRRGEGKGGGGGEEREGERERVREGERGEGGGKRGRKFRRAYGTKGGRRREERERERRRGREGVGERRKRGVRSWIGHEFSFFTISSNCVGASYRTWQVFVYMYTHYIQENYIWCCAT